ncbi:hypothetical protein EV44_g3573 [Erysiphe necator]|uniref:Integrase catalytic domain-containing protein n=1 Tax=Uncinula necator TaxID=52586 RepID=A0A0B1P0M3_UNCNE|nr:hypothetical protein EV44_g3573 [Erysiphe necator]
MISNLDLSNSEDVNEIYFTTFGAINGKKILRDLNDKAFLHALTGSTNTLATNNSDMRYGPNVFFGIMIDTGAAKKSTVGQCQYQAFQKISDVHLDTTTAGAAKIQFGIGNTTSIGSIIVNTPFGHVKFHVVNADTPFLLSIADMDKHGVYLNNIKNILVSPTQTFPVTRRFGHPFLLWKTHLPSTTHELGQECFLTYTELRRLHRRFGHPAAHRLQRLLERAGHNDINYGEIKRLTDFCEQCQKHGKSPGRFKFKLRDEINFNFTILVDIMFIDNSPILHIIDEATRYQAAQWLSNMTSEHVWDTLCYAWINTYLGPPDYIITDAGKNFLGKNFLKLIGLSES